MKIAYSTALVAFICLCFSVPAKSQSTPHNYIMDSLNPFASYEVKRRRYQALKNLGAEGVTIDIWWGIVEPVEGEFHWEIYEENFKLAKEAGLKIIPIMSYHSVNDGNAKFPVPEWSWNKGKDLKSKDSYGVENDEFLTYFSPVGHELRKNVLRSFKEHFHKYDSVIPKIYIGLGPSGEARHGSISSYWNYPGVGRHQAGSDSAKISFQNYLREKYKTIENLNKTWNARAESFESLDTPNDDLHFFQDGVNTPYGRDFMEWYQGALEGSVDQDQKDANEVLRTGENSFHGSLAGKIAGFYWLATDKVFPHGAERAAGYYNYDHLIKVFARNNFELTFTCFEMENKDYYPDFSRAADLVSEIAGLAKQNKVKLSGENASAFELNDFRSWESIEKSYRNIKNVFEHNDISAFTFLRADFLVNSDGSLRPEAALYRKYLTTPPPLTKQEEELASNRPNLEECTGALGGLHPPSLPLHP